MNVLATPQVCNFGTLRDLIADRCQKQEDVILFTREFYNAAIQMVLDGDGNFSAVAMMLFPMMPEVDSVSAISLWWAAMYVWYSRVLNEREQTLFEESKVSWKCEELL